MKPAGHLSKPKDNVSGIFYMTAASLAFALMVACVKLTSGHLPVFEVVFFRSLSGTLMMAALILRKGVSFWGVERKSLFLRGVSGFLALSLHFYTISKLPLGLAVMLNYTAPVFAAFMAVFFLKEKTGPFLWLMTLLSFAGIYFLTIPAGADAAWMTHLRSGEDRLNLILGLVSGIFAAIAYTTIRSIKHRESPLTIIFYFTFISTVCSTFLLAKGGVKWPAPLDWLGLTGVAIGSFFGQLWMTIAFRKAPASIVSPFSYLTPAFSFVLGYVFWRDPLTWRTLAGAGMIILAGSLISLREAFYD